MELEAARASLRATHHAWFPCALLIWPTSTSYDHKRDISQSNIIVLSH